MNIGKFLRTPALKSISKWLLLCTSLVSSTIIFQICKELLPHVQLLLLRNICCVISVDNKILRGLQLTRIHIAYFPM